MDIKKLAATRPNIIVYSNESIDTYATHAAMLEDAESYAKRNEALGEVVVVARVLGTVDANGQFEPIAGHEWGGHKDPEFIALSGALGRALHELSEERKRLADLKARMGEALKGLRGLESLVWEDVAF